MKYIVVTSANGGIGRITAQTLIEKGHDVIGLDLSNSDINNKKYHHICCDLTNDESLKNAIKQNALSTFI